VNITVEQANKTAHLLPAGSQVLWFCTQCGDKDPGPWVNISELSIAGSGDGTRWVKVVDLAYLYYFARDRTGRNVALEVGC